MRARKRLTFLRARATADADGLRLSVRGARVTLSKRWICESATGSWVPAYPDERSAATDLAAGEYLLAGVASGPALVPADMEGGGPAIIGIRRVELGWLFLPATCETCGAPATGLASFESDPGPVDWVERLAFEEIIAEATRPLRASCAACGAEAGLAYHDDDGFRDSFGLRVRHEVVDVRLDVATAATAADDATLVSSTCPASEVPLVLTPTPPPVVSRVDAVRVLAEPMAAGTATADYTAALGRLMDCSYQVAPADPALVALAGLLDRPSPAVAPMPEPGRTTAVAGDLAEAAAFGRLSSPPPAFLLAASGTTGWQAVSVGFDPGAAEPMWLNGRFLEVAVHPADPTVIVGDQQVWLHAVAAARVGAPVRVVVEGPMIGELERILSNDEISFDAPAVRVNGVVVPAGCERCGSPSDRLLVPDRRLSERVHALRSSGLGVRAAVDLTTLRAWCGACRPLPGLHVVADATLAQSLDVEVLHRSTQPSTTPVDDPVALVGTVEQLNGVARGWHEHARPMQPLSAAQAATSVHRYLPPGSADADRVVSLVEQALPHATSQIADDHRLALAYWVHAAAHRTGDAAAWAVAPAPRPDVDLAVVVAAIVVAPDPTEARALAAAVDRPAAVLGLAVRDLLAL